MAKIRKFEDVESWKRVRKLTKEIYKATGVGKFSRDFGLRDQIRRAAVSIMSNIAEALNGEVTRNSFSSCQWRKDLAVKREPNSM